MSARYHRPQQALSPFVRTLLVMDPAEQPEHDELPMVTHGMPALFCKIKENNVGIALFGKEVPGEYWKSDQETLIIAYLFLPFTLASVFNVAAGDISRKPLDLRKWKPQRANAVITQLLGAKSTKEKIEAIDALLMQLVMENRRTIGIIRVSTDDIMNDPGTDSLPALLEKLALTERTFQRTFKKFVGITPVQYRRICQFQATFSQLRGKEFNTMSDVAFDNGFADQSHFIRAFREFTQTTPKEYLRHGLKSKK